MPEQEVRRCVSSWEGVLQRIDKSTGELWLRCSRQVNVIVDIAHSKIKDVKASGGGWVMDMRRPVKKAAA